jgi:hypothetical protein
MTPMSLFLNSALLRTILLARVILLAVEELTWLTFVHLKKI